MRVQEFKYKKIQSKIGASAIWGHGNKLNMADFLYKSNDSEKKHASGCQLQIFPTPIVHLQISWECTE